MISKPITKVQISAKKSNFQFKFPKNSPLNFKFRLKILTFAPALNKKLSNPVSSHPQIKPKFSPKKYALY